MRGARVGDDVRKFSFPKLLAGIIQPKVPNYHFVRTINFEGKAMTSGNSPFQKLLAQPSSYLHAVECGWYRGLGSHIFLIRVGFPDMHCGSCSYTLGL